MQKRAVLKRKGKQSILAIVVQAKQRLKCILDDHLRKIDFHGNTAIAITFTSIKMVKEIIAISLRWCFYLEKTRVKKISANNWLWIGLLKQKSFCLLRSPRLWLDHGSPMTLVNTYDRAVICGLSVSNVRESIDTNLGVGTACSVRLH